MSRVTFTHVHFLVTQFHFLVTPFSRQDGNGYIDEQELDALLKDLCDKNKMVRDVDLSIFEYDVAQSIFRFNKQNL